MDVEIEEGGGAPISRCDIPNFHFAAKNGIFHIELTKPTFLTPHKMISWLDFWYTIAVLIKVSLFIYCSVKCPFAFSSPGLDFWYPRR